MQKYKKNGVPHYLVDKADGWSLAAVQEVNIYDLQLLQSDVEGLELAVVSVQRDHFEQAVIQPQADHTTLWVHDADDARFWRTPNTILQRREHMCIPGLAPLYASELKLSAQNWRELQP